jgi:ATP-dependent DNA ligase
VKGQTLILPARRLGPNCFAAWAEALHRGFEGMVAKDPESHYKDLESHSVGRRTLKWLKVKRPACRV